MSSETSGETTVVRTGEAAAVAGTHPATVNVERKCHLGDRHIHRDDLRKVWKECQVESFWYRALPLSLGSMAVTYGLIHQGIWKSSPRFGPFPKLAVAGILGYVAGKASYAGTCRSKMRAIGLDNGPGFGPWSKGNFYGPFGNSGPRSCHHVCEECKKKPQAEPVEEMKN